MSPTLSRRDFLRLTAAGSAAASVTVACQMPSAQTTTLKPGMRLRHAAVGVGGMGGSDLGQIASHPDVDIVALCDVDAGRLAEAAKKYPKARTFSSWRAMFEAMAEEIDSVHVTIPDHNHAIVAAWAMAMGMHVYCQKPLTHDVWEARMLQRAAHHHGAITQMGIQNHSGANYLSALNYFDNAPFPAVSEVHVWTDRPAGWWPQNVEMPEGEDEVPEGLDWNQWLGTAPDRPYVQGTYHAFVWRGRKAFGTGAQGDMACHLMDPALWFLGITAPTSVQSLGPKPTADSFPLWSEIRYQFPASARTHENGVKVVWYDGKRLPQDSFDAFGVEKPYANASFFISGDEAFMVSPYEPCRLFRRGEGEQEFTPPKVDGVHHWHQYVDACFGRDQCTANFDYAAPLSEVALLGNIAMEYPEELLQWNAEKLSFPSHPEADAWLKRRYRSKWNLPLGS